MTSNSNKSNNDDDGSVVWRTMSLADGIKNLILTYGIDACQEQLDAYRRIAASSDGGGGACPMMRTVAAAAPPSTEEKQQQEEDCQEEGFGSGITSIKINSLKNNDDDNDDDNMERLIESRTAAQSLAFHQLEHDAKLNHDIIEASFDGVFLVNEYGIIRMVNKSALIKFGYDSAAELVGRNISIICGQEHANMHDSYMEKYRVTRESRMIGSQPREVSARRKDGSEFPCKIGIKVMEHEGSNELLMLGFVRDLTWEKRTMEMIIQAKIAENLLVNMLPKEIALRLKNDPNHDLVADHHDSATILFADIVGFTSMSSRIAPIEVVRLLNGLFGRFDKLVDKYDLNKVKTIGDCYMVTSIPSVKSPAEMAADICAFGLDMLDELHDFINTSSSWSSEAAEEEADVSCRQHDPPLELRVGINSGPVVAGIIGTKRYMYDIWGDSVNVASRMESTGVPGKVQVTKEVVELVESLDSGGRFMFVKRGLVDVKGKGRIETHFLENKVTI